MVRLPFVARAGVVADIGTALDAARRSTGALLLITGEPGVGKSRVAEEVAARAGWYAREMLRGDVRLSGQPARWRQRNS
ncbi:MAG TPA: AAA family ATPase [Pseudonocardiaceae bacterium]